MKRKIIKILASIIFGNPLSFSVLRFINRHKLLILSYHSIFKNNDGLKPKVPWMAVDIERFDEQIRFLRGYYNFISEKDIVSALEYKKKLPDFSVWITFDDGFRDSYINAYPILKEYRVPATFFIVTSLLEDKADCHMSWEQVREMYHNGLSIGSHTIHHKVLSQLSDQELINEITGSKKELEEKLNIKVDSFAYPYGSRPKISLNRCYSVLTKSGFKIAVTTIAGRNCVDFLRRDRFKLRRINACGDDTLGFFKAKIAGGYLTWKW
jgi:peptidoglycan/xylan/chitin deacetylase (PgdA/CDA1 family)